MSFKLYEDKNKYHQCLNTKFDSRKLAFNKAKYFIKKCLSSNIIKFQTTILFGQPYASVVIPLYNSEKYITRTIKSIQYQNLSNIEIILIDDNSTDNTLDLVGKMKHDDKRIKIIKNKKNMGILYSRSIGVLSSKGKYLKIFSSRINYFIST